MELIDLSILSISVQNRYRENFKPEDCTLPSSFKLYFQKFNYNDIIEYFEYSLVVHASSSLDIYIPNQWIYIAYYFVDYYNMLKAYRDKVLSLLSKEEVKSCANNEERARILLNRYDENDKEFLIKFLSDYTWWGGGKTIDRNDYFVSPILSLAALVNASQSYVADICKNLAESEDAFNELDYFIKNQDKTPKVEIEDIEVNQVILRELKEHYTSNELAQELEQMQKKLGYSGIHLFALKYAPFIKNENLKELCKKANIPESYSAELNKMRNLYDAIKNKQFGVAFYEDITFRKRKKIDGDKALQIIYYGAPGTGKSYTIDSMTTEENSVRTTFHPDSDYASFVGAYKPTMEEIPLTALVGTDAHFAVPKNGHPGTEKKIVYKYVPQAFLKAYVEAWKRYAGEDVEKETFDLPLYPNNNSAKDNEENKSNGISPYYLIIEEINRGNCAQIFGDLFQLLDRNNMGSSSYPIHADDDIARFLKEDEKGFAGLTDSQRKAISDFVLVKDSKEERKIGEDILNGKLLLLPPNLHVWATMNTSDQSLFPIDSAFKRRWDWEYTPISYNPKDKKTGEEINWTFEAGGNLYSWGDFLSKINPEIESLTESADKQMGYFFAKANPATGIISEKIFINKVLFYLWTEVLKDFDMGNGIFKNPETNKSFKFTDFFDEKQNAVFNFLQNLKLTPLNPQNGNSSEDFEQLEDESRIDEIFEETNIENPSALQYSINDSEPFQKTYLAAEVFKKFISLNPLMTPNEVLNSWREKQKEWKAQKIYVPAHLIEDEESYKEYIENSRGDKKKNEARFERVPFKDKYFYLWKGWGDGKNDNITSFLTAINSSGWDINIKRVNETSD